MKRETPGLYKHTKQVAVPEMKPLGRIRKGPFFLGKEPLNLKPEVGKAEELEK